MYIMLSRTTALYCKCVKQKNGNIPLKNIIAYFCYFLILFLRSFSFCTLPFFAFVHFILVYCFFFFLVISKCAKKYKKRITIIIIITKYHCPVALLKIYTYVYNILWIRRNNNNQIWDDTYFFLNQNSLCVWPSDDVAMLPSVLRNF